VGGCCRLIEELCHIKAHRTGSPREARDLFGACHRHHVLYDADPAYIGLLGWSPEGRPIFFNRRMESIHPVPRPTRETTDGMLRPFVPPENVAAIETPAAAAPPPPSAVVATAIESPPPPAVVATAIESPPAAATQPRWPDAVRDAAAPAGPSVERRGPRQPPPAWVPRPGESLHHRRPRPSRIRARARSP
jgi:hypothetical protein